MEGLLVLLALAVLAIPVLLIIFMVKTSRLAREVDALKMDVRRLQAGDGDRALSTRPQRRRGEADEYLTAEAVVAIQRWAAEDFDRFGYARDPHAVLSLVPH